MLCDSVFTVAALVITLLDKNLIGVNWCDKLNYCSIPLRNINLNNLSFIFLGFKKLVKDLVDSGEPIQPIEFLQNIFQAMPRFSERAEQGGFVQQVSSFLDILN